jgi:serine protease Do
MLLKQTGILVVLAFAILSPGLSQAQQRAHSTTMRRATAGYLGVGVIGLTDDRVRALNLKDDRGVEVKRVTEGSPAAKAGVKEGDVVLDVNGRTSEDVGQFIRSIADTAPGTKVTLGIWRNGSRQSLTATLEERPANQSFAPEMPDGPIPPMPPMPPMPGSREFPLTMGDSPRVGFEGEALSPQLAEYFGVKEGVLVRTVNARTPAEKAGLKAGDVVVKVDGMTVATPLEITGLVRASRKKTITFSVVRNKKEMAIDVDIASAAAPEPRPDRVPL